MQNFHVLIKGSIVPLLVAFRWTRLLFAFQKNCLWGPKVTLIGREGEKEITATEVADYRGTINYEVVCLFE